MFEIKKGAMHFWVLDADKPVIVPDLNTVIVTKEQLLVIRNNLTRLAKYRLRKADPKNRQEALEKYLAAKGWIIRRLRCPMYVTESGDLVSSY